MTPEEAQAALQPIVAAFAPFMQSLSDALTKLSRWADENMELFKRIEKQLEEIEEKGD